MPVKRQSLFLFLKVMYSSFQLSSLFPFGIMVMQLEKPSSKHKITHFYFNQESYNEFTIAIARIIRIFHLIGAGFSMFFCDRLLFFSHTLASLRRDSEERKISYLLTESNNPPLIAESTRETCNSSTVIYMMYGAVNVRILSMLTSAGKTL